VIIFPLIIQILIIAPMEEGGNGHLENGSYNEGCMVKERKGRVFI